ncbi:hypothetical protein KP509_29G019900 [Ceratopteris richardii]|uniref:ENTH domain-containing protein n=1 Tax=Ceratopteris richardii TaxID=49495 RepID=A0A8T2R557_CERRI|nr:hypothetical protein KP509_29G019900 [Ceratopteris richardii]KAH7291510.1 hypothetical protein KP509_29G019900 [Ceratopteris richardii]KAH7291511.1 hypothetical protein KP509_29G019900 [Ceratopteris richardii]KAH7291512.1 hypothetical protein KP509_29G019900 [Ceratopteris richardii]
MDFMKVIDQTVRELKREVNKTILKVPEIEQKVLDATSNEPWGPHGTLMSEIAHATKNYYEMQMIMEVLWKRMSDTGRNWRHVYKALTVMEFLVAHGSERVIEDIREHTHQIATLADFEYVEPNGRDQGINVRKKSQSLMGLINDRDKIREVRQKAADNRDKYRGISSTGGTFQSTGGRYNDYRSNDDYGRYGMEDTDRNKRDDYQDNDGRKNEYSSRKDDEDRRIDYSEDAEYYSSTSKSSTIENLSNPPHYEAASQTTQLHVAENQRETKSVKSSSANDTSDDYDDFNPRASSVASQSDDLLSQPKPAVVPAAAPAPKVSPPSLVSPNFFDSTDDLFGNPSSVSVTSAPVQNSGDLLGNALFDMGNSHSIPTVALGGIKPPRSYASSVGVSDTTTTFPASIKPPAHSTANGAIPVDVSTFGAFNNSVTSSVVPASTSLFDDVDFFGLDASSVPNSIPQPAFANTSPALQAAGSEGFQTGQTSFFQEPSGITKPQQKQFETKSGVWADGLSKGLIDLNISASTKTNSLADIGITFDQLRSEKPKDERLPTAMGKAMGPGSGLGKAGASTMAPPPAPMAMNRIGMKPLGMGMNMNVGAAPMMHMGLNPGATVKPTIGMGATQSSSASGVGMGMSMNSNFGSFPDQQQQYGGYR